MRSYSLHTPPARTVPWAVPSWAASIVIFCFLGGGWFVTLRMSFKNQGLILFLSLLQRRTFFFFNLEITHNKGSEVLEKLQHMQGFFCPWSSINRN